ncbi:type III secretion system export apparatus subunit SctU [Undibacterium sp. SXout7W]|uniref:type III secretion system export apparatus subunit SctU n=1 Tax=Undibacterium sp. SXout7W TaxID=3413049 RepID=UPI003BF39CB0
MSDEKNEKPTDKKLDDARKKGQVAVSRDLARLIMLVSVMEFAFITEPLWRQSLLSLITLSTNRLNEPFPVALAEMLHAAGMLLFLVFGAFFLLCIVMAMVAYWGQFGVLLAPDMVTPKFDKIDPVNGLKQLFSKKKLGELLLSLLKAVVISLITYILIRSQLGTILQFAGGSPKDIYFGFFELVRLIFHVVAGLFIVIAVLDFALQKYLHAKSLNMDMEEIKKEHKESEGDPMIKGMRKQLARQFAMEGPTSQTQKANAVVVNPTHFAVAMLFDSTTPVPIVLAKGKDEIAQAMIATAKESGIPVIRHVWLARTLYATCRTNAVVPKSSYEAVAHVYAVVSEMVSNRQTDRTVELENYGEPPSTYHDSSARQ